MLIITTQKWTTQQKTISVMHFSRGLEIQRLVYKSEKGSNISAVQCQPATKLLSASKDSTSNLKKHLEGSCSWSLNICIQYPAWNTLCDFCPDFPPILQSEQVDASWGKSEPVCRLQLTDSTENLVVYDGHRLVFFSFSLWFYPVRGYQKKKIQSILEHICFHLSFVS